MQAIYNTRQLILFALPHRTVQYIEFEELQTVTCGNGFESKCSPPYHIHLHQEEVFTVLEGDFMYMLEGEVCDG